MFVANYQPQRVNLTRSFVRSYSRPITTMLRPVSYPNLGRVNFVVDPRVFSAASIAGMDMSSKSLRTEYIAKRRDASDAASAILTNAVSIRISVDNGCRVRVAADSAFVSLNAFATYPRNSSSTQPCTEAPSCT